MTTYIRPSGSKIELKDTPEMAEFAKSQGWKVEKVEKKAEPKETPVKKEKPVKKAKKPVKQSE